MSLSWLCSRVTLMDVGGVIRDERAVLKVVMLTQFLSIREINVKDECCSEKFGGTDSEVVGGTGVL